MQYAHGAEREPNTAYRNVITRNFGEYIYISLFIVRVEDTKMK